jgi:nucleotide-binding universal stress UspA family protein
MIDPDQTWNDPVRRPERRDSLTQRRMLLLAVADDAQAPGLLTFATRLAEDGGFGLLVAHVASARPASSATDAAAEGSSGRADLPWELSGAGVRAWTQGGQLLRGLGVSDDCSMVALGDPSRQLLRIGRECEAAFVVVGTSGCGPLRIAIRGSVSRELAVRGDRPVVVVEPEATSRGSGGSIVCGVDGNLDDALVVARVAADLAARLDLPLILVHVLEVHDHLHWESDEPLEALVDPNARQAIQLMLPIMRAVEEDIDPHAILRPGRTSRQLLDVADETDAALIVVGCRGHGPLRTVVEGSVSLSLCRRAHRPVVVVPLRPQDDRR